MLFFTTNIFGYHEPTVNLGQTNILDGGPLIPLEGWYWRPYLSIYHAQKFTGPDGKLLGGVPSPQFNNVTLITQFLYQSGIRIFHGKLGVNLFLPAVLYSHVSDNQLGISSSGSGLGDFITGLFLQWEPKALSENKQVTLTARLALDVSFPTGKNKQPFHGINPGNNLFFINPFWAATFHFTRDLATSWRLHYLWCSKNRKTHIQPGQAVHLNFDMEYQFFPKFWLGAVGYYFKQITDSKLQGLPIPNSREQVLGTGLGALYTTPTEWRFLSYFYIESRARNRPQGVRFIARIIKHI